MPETGTTYVLMCRECDDEPMPFGSVEERGRWAASHTAATGHTRWWVSEVGPVGPTRFDAVPGQQFLHDGSPIEWADDGGPTMAEYDDMDAQDYAEMREAGQLDDEDDA